MGLESWMGLGIGSIWATSISGNKNIISYDKMERFKLEFIIMHVLGGFTERLVHDIGFTFA